MTLEDYKRYKSVLQNAKEEGLKEADIILCTCSVAGGK